MLVRFEKAQRVWRGPAHAGRRPRP